MYDTVEEKPHDSVPLTIVNAVATTTGTASTDLPPLAEVIDPDAVETLFESVAGPTAADGQLTFRYAGCTVVVESDGGVSATPRAEESADSHSMAVEG